MGEQVGLTLLLGQGEQYDHPDDWRELVRSRRVRRGSEVAVREDGRTSFRRAEDVPGLSAVLDEIDPLPVAPAPPRPALVSPSEPPASTEAVDTASWKTEPPAQGAAPPPPRSLDIAEGVAEDSNRSSAFVVSPPAAPAGYKPAKPGLSAPAVAAIVAGGFVLVAVVAQITLSTRPLSTRGAGASNGLTIQTVDPTAAAPMTTTPPEPKEQSQPVNTTTPDAPADAPQPAASPAVPDAAPVAEASPPAAPAPSFDCAKAVDWSARQVCAAPALAALDRRMADLYAGRMAATTGDERAQVLFSQRRWIAQRKSCEGSPDPAGCLRGVYEGRVAELASRPAPAPDQPDDDVARTAAAGARACIQRDDLDCAESNLRTLLAVRPGREDARRLLDQIRDRRRAAFQSDWNAH